MAHTVDSYRTALQAELDKLLALMDQEWGVRPEITLAVQPALLVVADYPRRWPGREAKRFWIPGNRLLTTRSPLAIARQIACEVAKKQPTLPRGKYPVLADTPAKFLSHLRKELKALGVTAKLTAEVAVHVMADYNLKGFAHKGNGTYVAASQATGRKKPELVAKKIVGELADHRQTCDRCGEGVAPIHSRVTGQKWGWVKGEVDVPADKVELLVRPRLAKKINQRLGVLS